MQEPTQLTPINVTDAYLAHWPRLTNTFSSSLERWPDQFAAVFTVRPLFLEELMSALNVLAVEGQHVPGFEAVRQQIFHRRNAAKISAHEYREAGRECEYCRGDGYVTVLAVAKPGTRHSRVMVPTRPESIPARAIYPFAQPCCCAEGDRVNSDQKTGCAGGDVETKPSYRYLATTRQKLAKLRVTPEQAEAFERECESMYREEHGLAMLKRHVPGTRDTQLDALVAVILDRAVSMQGVPL